MTYPITDPADLARVRQLSDALDVALAEVNAANGRIVDARDRRTQLGRQQAAHRDAQPQGITEMEDDASKALASNPIDTTSEWYDKLRIARAAFETEVDAWNAKAVIIDQALGKVGAEMGAAEGRAADARNRAASAYGSFIHAARDAMASEFERRWAGVYADCFAYLDALDRAPKLWERGTRLHTGPRRMLSHDSHLTMMTPVSEALNFSGFQHRKLYPAPDENHADALTAIETFRTALKAVSPEGGTTQRASNRRPATA